MKDKTTNNVIDIRTGQPRGSVTNHEIPKDLVWMTPNSHRCAGQRRRRDREAAEKAEAK